MATYTHQEVATSTYWGDLDVTALATVDAGGAFIVLNNTDGTQTRLNGTGLTATGSGSSFTITGGTITSLDHLNSDGSVTIEQITGLSYAATSFQSHIGDSNLIKIISAVFSGADTLNGYSGNDTLEGGGGGDILNGGLGIDTASYAHALAAVTVNLNTAANSGEAAGDSYSSIENIIGSDFDDSLFGSNLDNVIFGGLGNDTLSGSNGTGTGGIPSGDDTLDGGAGIDTATYASNTNITAGITATLSATSTVVGDAVVGIDTLISVERVRGTHFADTFTATTSFSGSNGLFNEFQGDGGDDIIHGNGDTSLAYSGALAGVTVDLGAATAQSTAAGDLAGIGNDTFTGVNAVVGSNFADTLVGDSQNNTLSGGSGNDILEGAGGADVLDGGAGSDTASYAHASVGITASLADPTQNTDVAAGDSYISIENFRGSHFNDILIGDAGDNVLSGGLGGDVLNGGSGGTDTVAYDLSTAGLTADLADPTQNTGEASGDSYIAIENLRGSDFNDVLLGDGNNNQLDGGTGGDVLNGGGGTDTATYLRSTAGVTASLADSTQNTGDATGDSYISIENLRGSAFSDTLIGNAGNNTLNGGAGADVLNGGGGTDTASYQNSTAGITANLADPTQNTGEAAGDSYDSIANLRGSAFNDTLIGNAGNNTLNGGAGADVLNGGGGSDTASYQNSTTGITANLRNPAKNTGEAAGDTYTSIENLTGSDFNDTLVGDAGNNTLNGGAGNLDIAHYSSNSITGPITVNVSSAAKTVVGDASVGTDTLISVERVLGTSFADTYTAMPDAPFNEFDGAGGDDTINGNGIDTRAQYFNASAGVTVQLLGTLGSGSAHSTAGGDAAGIGADVLNNVNHVWGSTFADILTAAGGSGNFEFTGDAGDDTIIGTSEGISGLDSNTVIYDAFDATGGVAVSMHADGTGTVVGDASIGTDTLIGVEGVRGTAFVDTYTAAVGFSAEYGLRNDFEGLGGNDTVTGNGFTRISYTLATAAVNVNFATGIATSIAGGDAAGIGTDNFTGVNNVRGSDFNDTLIGSSGAQAERFTGGRGSDTINGGGGLLDSVNYAGTGATAVNVNLSTGTAADGFGTTDSISNIQGAEGTGFNDTLIGDANDNRLVGRGGNDILHGGAGNDILVGDHTIDPWGGVFGGSVDSDTGNDTLDGGAGGDQLWGGTGNDTLDGGDGIDVAFFSGARAAYTVTINGNNAQVSGPDGTDVLTNVERAVFDDGLVVLIDQPPTVISDGGGDTATLMVAESTSVVTTVAASDPDPDTTFSYSIVGGDDQALFQIDAVTGVLSFISAPTFEVPVDADHNNSYLVQVQASDGTVSDTQSLTINIIDILNTINGDSGDNSLAGTPQNDLINGLDGNDTVFAGAGTDIVNGGDGNDTLVGNDDIFASEPDTLNGSNGNDTILGEPSDTISGGPGTDTLQAVNANPWTIDLGANSIEYMLAGFGDDHVDASTQTVGVTVFAQGGDDVVTGSAFDDNLWGGVGNDTLTGGDGNDLLFGDLGADSLSGGNGNDTIYADSSDTHIDGGAGTDALYWAAGVNANIDLAADSIEFVQTLGDNDTLTAATGNAPVVIFAGAGNDTVTGGSGDDFLWGEDGNDTILGGVGSDTLVGGAGADRLTGGGGTDNLYGNLGGGGDGAADTYVFDTGWGTDFVYDFDNGIDKFDMTGSGAANFAALTVTDVGLHAQIAFGSNLIVVVGAAGQIDASDFVF